jgi:hypothetical protein
VSNKPQVGERYEIDGRTVQITAVTGGYVYGVRLTKAGKFIKRSRPDFNCNLKAWEGLQPMVIVEQEPIACDDCGIEFWEDGLRAIEIEGIPEGQIVVCDECASQRGEPERGA